MRDLESNGKPTPFQKIIIQQIARHLDMDGYCRMTNADLAKICSDVKKKRISKEITLLVSAGYLNRGLLGQRGPNYYSTERKLSLTKEAIADA